MDVLFDSRISCRLHVVISPYFRHLYLVLDCLRVVVDVFEVVVEFFEVVVGGCRWLLTF